MNLEGIMLHDINWSENDRCHMISLIYESKITKQMNKQNETEIDS